MSKKGFFILCGAPGLHKSTWAAATFQGSAYIASSPNVLQYYENDFLKTPDAVARGCKMPTQTKVIDVFAVNGVETFSADGMPQPVAQKATLETTLRGVVNVVSNARRLGQPLPWRNLVIDEVGTFWTRIFEEIKPTATNHSGKPDGFKAYNDMAQWSVNVCNVLRYLVSAGMNVVFVAHDQEPDKDRDKKGGPKVVSQAIMRQMCADADAVLLSQFEDGEVGQPTRQVWVAHGSQFWLSKIRGIPAQEFAAVKNMKLWDIVARAGFEA